MKKHMLFFKCLIFVLLFLSIPLKAEAVVVLEGVEEGAEEGERGDSGEEEFHMLTDELENMWNENYMYDITNYLDRVYGGSVLDAGKLWKQIFSGNIKEGLKDFWKEFIRTIFYEFSAGKEVFMTILLLTVLSSLFTVIMDIVENKQVSQLGFYFIYLLLCIILGRVFRLVYQETGELLLSVTDFVKVLLPAYAAALGLSNGATTAVVYYEGILFVIWFVEEALYHVILPCIEFYVLLSIMNGVWTEERLTSLLQTVKRGVEFALKAIMWIVGSIGALEALITPVIDSLSWNTAKKLTSIIPGVGDISEGVSEIFVGSAVLIRNGIGVFATVILLFLCMAPLCKIFAVAGCLKAASALGAVANHSRLTSCSDRVAEASFLLCKALLTGIGLFLMSIAITILAVNRNM